MYCNIMPRYTLGEMLNQRHPNAMYCAQGSTMEMGINELPRTKITSPMFCHTVGLCHQNHTSHFTAFPMPTTVFRTVFTTITINHNHHMILSSSSSRILNPARRMNRNCRRL